MRFRFSIALVCLLGSISGGLLFALMTLKFNLGFIGFLLAVGTPVLFCRYAGIQDQQTLIMIGVYATIGVIAGGMMQPVAAMTRDSRIALNARLPLAGHESLIAGNIFALVLATGRAFFCKPPTKKLDASIGGELLPEADTSSTI